MLTAAMLKASPATGPLLEVDRVAACIEACLTCAQACTSNADSCLGEAADLRMCISANVTCADICEATARTLSRATVPSLAVVRALLTTCMLACRACADECERHDREHHALCAKACRDCEQLCLDLARAIAL